MTIGQRIRRFFSPTPKRAVRVTSVIDGNQRPSASNPSTQQFADDQDSSDASISIGTTLSLLLWLAIQISALGLAAGRVPLWGRAAQVTELWAVEYLIIAQIAGSALTFPWLMGSWRSTAVVISTVWPFLFLAALFSPMPIGSIVCVGAYITAWLLALAILLPPLSSTEARLTAIAIAGLWAAGGPIFTFLHLEYAAGEPHSGRFGTLMRGPIEAGIRLVHGESRIALGISSGAIAVAIAVAAVHILRRCHMRHESQAAE